MCQLELPLTEYCEELLLSHLQGGAIKEALAITLLLKFRADHSLSSVQTTPPDWFPPVLISATQETLNERLSFLTALSMKPTARERPLKSH